MRRRQIRVRTVFAEQVVCLKKGKLKLRCPKIQQEEVLNTTEKSLCHVSVRLKVI